MPMPAEIARMINDLGKNLTLTSKATGAYNTSTSAAAVTSTNTTVKGMVMDYKARERDGEVIKAGDRKAVVKAFGITTAPAVDDYLDSGRIVNVRLIEEKGVVIAYICQLRY